MSSVCRFPCSRADFPRSNSHESGFFFCGISEDPVQNASGSSTNLNSALLHRIRSSAIREMCTPNSAHADGKLDEQVAIRDRVHGVLRDLRPAFRVDEAQRLRRELAIDRQRRAGDRARSERTPVRMLRDVAEARPIAIEHLQPGKKMMREKHRLRPLQMRVSRNQHVAIRLGQRQQRALRAEDFFRQNAAGVLEKQPHVRRDLVVPAARRVQLGGGRHALRQRLLDVHVHILELGVPLEFPRRRSRRGSHQARHGSRRVLSP